ncbi:MAG: secretin N-terminal domain-containing protein [Opitutaceae bacterium]|nr:secretin N-terminal domain-containing protein [Opitutaceae bacterium]
MTPRFVCVRLAVIACVLVSMARAQPAPTPLPQPPNQPGSGRPPPPAAGVQPAASPGGPGGDEAMVQEIVLPDADLDTILTALENLTGRIILRPAMLPTATYNLKIKKPIPKAAAIRYIETVLALNGIGVVALDNNAYKVTALTMSRTEAPEMLDGSAFDLPPSGKVATKLFQLEFMRVAELFPMLQGMLNPLYGGPVQLPNANAYLITDSVSNLQRVEFLLQQVDKPLTAGMKPKFYQLREAKASDLVTKLRTILTGTLQIQLGSATTYSADDRTNQIILVTDPRQYSFFDEMIQRLDVRADPNTRNDVIYLNHAKALDVVNVIGQLIRGQTTAIQQRQSGSVRPGQLPTQPGQPQPPTMPGQPPAVVTASGSSNPALDGLLGSSSNEFSSIMTVVNDDRSNSLVVSGTGDDIRLLRDLVAKLDRVLAQVRIEVVIAEVTLDDQHQSGISALGLKLDGDKLVGFSGSANSDSVVVTNGTLTRPGASGAWDLAAEITINSTPRKSKSAIISQPAIVTSHGKASEIFSGETRPVVTGSITSGTIGGTTSTTTQLRIGTRLNVTPFIGADGSVQLELKQTVEDVTSTIVIDNNPQPIIGTRETTSYVTAKSGEIIVLGGFQKKIDSKSNSRLGPIPIIGDLFGARNKQQYRQELIFFLRPVVLTNDPNVDNADALRRIDRLPNRDDIKQQLDPNFQPPPPSPYLLDRILPKG